MLATAVYSVGGWCTGGLQLKQVTGGNTACSALMTDMHTTLYLLLCELLAQVNEDMAQLRRAHESVAVLVEDAQALNKVIGCAGGVNLSVQVRSELLKCYPRSAIGVNLRDDLLDLWVVL